MSRLLSVLAVTAALTVGCTEGQKTNPVKRAPEDSARPEPGKRSLYERLGGEQALARVVEDFIANVKADPNIRKKHKDHFDMGDVAALKKKLIDQIGGPRGRSFGKKRFQELLKQNRGAPMHQQEESLRQAFEEYQGRQLRRDDLTVLGFIPHS